MRTRIFGGVVSLALALPLSVAASDAQSVRSVYDLYLGPVWAGELSIDADYAGDRYDARSALRTAGAVGLLYRASFEAKAQGNIRNGAHVPERFMADSKLSSKKQFVEMIYTNEAPRQVNARPAFVPKPYQIDPAQQVGTLDPISAAISALAPRPMPEVCNRSVDVFDGRRRYAIDLGAPKADGARIKCEATYRRIAGFKPKMMKKQTKFPFTIWYEPRGDGLAEIVRAAGKSMFSGLAVITLRK